MSTAAPDGIPARVAIETPRGHVREGDVVATDWEATVAGLARILTVEIEGVRFRIPSTDILSR